MMIILQNRVIFFYKWQIVQNIKHNKTAAETFSSYHAFQYSPRTSVSGYFPISFQPFSFATSFTWLGLYFLQITYLHMYN
jgi:hypothetical protein